MTEAQIIKRLRQQIPVVQCIPGCHDCCNDIILFADWEWSQIKEKRIADSLTCPYLSKCGCEIYHQRPIICRLYGTSLRPILKCKYDCKPIFPLSEEKELKIYQEFIKLFSNNILNQLSKTADIIKISAIVEALPNKKSVTRFIERLPDRLAKRNLKHVSI